MIDFEALVSGVMQPLERFVKFRVGNLSDAEDILQEVLTAAYRGAETLLDSIPVVLARSEFEDIGENGRRYTVYLTDVLISGSLNYRPAKGDRITINGAVYIVRPMGKELYRFDDPYKTLVRVHTQLETGSL